MSAWNWPFIVKTEFSSNSDGTFPVYQISVIDPVTNTSKQGTVAGHDISKEEMLADVKTKAHELAQELQDELNG